jgi:hypothetical protein
MMLEITNGNVDALTVSRPRQCTIEHWSQPPKKPVGEHERI